MGPTCFRHSRLRSNSVTESALRISSSVGFALLIGSPLGCHLPNENAPSTVEVHSVDPLLPPENVVAV
ncbi:MAG: hypothetical protein SH850_13685 [Planctomycetaceae bacterium]|nr:hypothetical protein [Planctomycetaceae bacterium]